MKNKLSYLVVLIFFTFACNLPMTGDESSPPIADSEIPTFPVQEVVATTVPATSSPENNIMPTVQHFTQPGEPSRIRTWVTDRSSAAYASEHRSVGDGYDQNLFERPFTAGEMQYQPYLDLTKVEVSEGGEWIYVIFSLEGNPPTGVDAFYAIEIDLDRDGRGDWLIGTTTPASTAWSADGAKAWRDSNNDVGGGVPMTSEAPLTGIDGFDELIFDGGHGTDPDAVWGRMDPASGKRVQLAFKQSVIASADTFLFGGWSDEGVQKAGWFDYNDHFTLTEAGSPLNNSSYYPLAALFSVDNTCRWSYGFEPTTDYPGLCPLPEPTPPPATDPTPDICFPPTSYVCQNWNYTTCQCDDAPPSCPPPEGGCGDNSEWLPYPNCYCAPY